MRSHFYFAIKGDAIALKYENRMRGIREGGRGKLAELGGVVMVRAIGIY